MSEKIAFVSMGDVFTTPYLAMYESVFDGGYDLIYWQRSSSNETRSRANGIPFHSESSTPLAKSVGYLKFARFARRTLEAGKYSRVVFLQTQPAVLLSRYLTSDIDFKYACDIRDYSFEHNPLYYHAERRVLKRSSLTVISSPAYRSFLPPECTYHTLHNSHPDLAVREVGSRPSRDTITITYIGTIRFIDECRRFIAGLSGDPRFRLRFIGAGADRLRVACTDLDLTNCEFMDVFDSSRTVSLLEDTDLIFNMYGAGTPLLDYALSNKLYYAAELGIPILVSPRTYMATMAERFSLGIALDPTMPGCSSYLYEHVTAFDYAAFDSGRQELLKEVADENGQALEQIVHFLTGTSRDLHHERRRS